MTGWNMYEELRERMGAEAMANDASFGGVLAAYAELDCDEICEAGIYTMGDLRRIAQDALDADDFEQLETVARGLGLCAVLARRAGTRDIAFRRGPGDSWQAIRTPGELERCLAGNDTVTE
jgi:hypothetical protein